MVATTGDISHQAELLGCRAARLCVLRYVGGKYVRVRAERGVHVGDKDRCYVWRREEKRREDTGREAKRKREKMQEDNGEIEKKHVTTTGTNVLERGA